MALFISTRENQFDSAKKEFFFRNRYSGIVETEELVRRIAENNTTLTQADTLACMDVMEDVVLELLADGKRVRTPFGMLFLAASGTVAERDTPFTPHNSASGHTLHLRFRENRQFSERAAELAAVNREESKEPETPVIYDITDGFDEPQAAYQCGAVMKITGVRLGFDEAQNDEGVFFAASDGTQYRTDKIIHNKPSLLIIQVPDNLPAGTYTVQVSARCSGSKTVRTGRSDTAVAVSV